MGDDPNLAAPAYSLERAVSLYVALVHYPVLNRRGETIASAVTNLDLHDLARAARTYDIPACYIVTPLQDQQVLIGRLLDHWCRGVGRELHPDREEALKRLCLADSLGVVKEALGRKCGRAPVVWATTANRQPGALSHWQARRQLTGSENPFLLVFGTGWGLAPAALQEVDAVLEPIPGRSDYNHLSVRCAAAILLDRLLSVE